MTLPARICSTATSAASSAMRSSSLSASFSPRLATATTRGRVFAAATQPTRRGVTTLKQSLYTAKAKATGQGRDGKASLTEEGPFEVKLAMPKSLGGAGNGQNPEQLFALGYASCFLSALNLVARTEKLPLPKGVECSAHVSIGPPDEGPKPFAIGVDLEVRAPGGASDEERERLRVAADKAHEICPYSNATRGNVPVKLTVA